MDDVASGQRMIIFSILMNLAAIGLRAALGDAWMIIAAVALVAAVEAIFGLLRVTSGLGYPPMVKAGLIALVFVPLAGFLMLAVINSEATKALKAAGYEVGFLGARPKRGTL